jgi:hypothetical protein
LESIHGPSHYLLDDICITRCLVNILVVKAFRASAACKPVVLTAYFDANSMHGYTTGRSVTGVLHLVNQTPIDWYSKHQATVETATYGSELVAGRTANEQVMDIRYTLRMMGVPIDVCVWRQHIHDSEQVEATVGFDEASQCFILSSGTRSGSGRNHLVEPCDKCQQNGGSHV